MFSLFIDTHDKNLIIGIYKDGKILDSEKKESTRNHGDYTMPMLQEVLNRNNISVHDLNEIIVVNGPGSFTGVRIGVTIAKTLAYCLNIPIKAISSLEINAISNNTNKPKIVIIRDIKGVFVGEFDANNKYDKEFYYMANQEFEDYITKNNLNEFIIESEEVNFDDVYTYLLDVEPTTAHKVNPMYIKVIEALKNDKTSN